MKISILGSGDVGQVLGRGFVEEGHQVMMGTRNPGQTKIKNWLAKVGPNGSAGTFAEAAAFGDLAVLATLWSATETVIRLADPKNLAGKTVIDATNPLDFSAGMPPKLAIGLTDSGGESVQRWLRESHVVKAFNTVGNPQMVHPQFMGGPPDMLICGDDSGAKKTATDLIKQLGWSVVDLGGIEASRYLEPMAMIWIIHFFQTNSPNHAFKLLRK